MKLRTWWPAIVGIVALAIIYFAVRRGPAETATPAAPAHSGAPVVIVAPDSPTAPMPDAALAAAGPTIDDTAPALTPATPPPDTAPAPDAKAKKPKMTLDERLAEAQKHLGVMTKRAELLDKEVAALERDGKTKEAAEQRIVIQRLQAHMDKLRSAIAERRDPE